MGCVLVIRPSILSSVRKFEMLLTLVIVDHHIFAALKSICMKLMFFLCSDLFLATREVKGERQNKREESSSLIHPSMVRRVNIFSLLLTLPLFPIPSRSHSYLFLFQMNRNLL